MFEFSRTYRLVSKQDFQSVFANPNKATQKNLLALYCPNQKDYARLGIIIAKHHIKLAVHRNKLRRFIRESFRHQKETLKGLDIVVLLRSKCSPLDNNAIRTDLNSLWEKLIIA